MERGARRGLVALAFAVAALAACWNPLSAPFGAVTAIGAAVVSLRALRAPPPGRGLARAGLSVALVALGASAVVLALTAGVGRPPAGEPIVAPRDRAEVQRILDDAAGRSRGAREKAREELERLDRQGLTPPGK